MPSYDYRCDRNQRELEVRHSINTEIKTWGELCELAGISPGDTPLHSPVKRLATGGSVIGTGNLGHDAPPVSGGCCGGGACGMH